MIKGITYSSGNMDKAAAKCIASMLNNGADEACKLHMDECTECLSDFYMLNRETLNAERGAGYWLWKAHLIYNAMYFMENDDYLIYSDAGIEFVDNVRHIINRMDQDIFMFTNTFKQVEWTKGSIMDMILPEWRDGRYNNNMQVQASVIFIRVNQNTRNFIKEWLLFCQMPGLIDDSPSATPNFPTFAENRHDQSILCALQIKHRYKLHWFPTTTAHHIKHLTPDDNYPVLMRHHRLRDNEW